MHSRCKLIKAECVGCGSRVASELNAPLISRPPHVSGSGEVARRRFRAEEVLRGGGGLPPSLPPQTPAIRKNSFPSVCFHCQCNNNKTYYTPYKIWRWLFVCLAFCGLRRRHDLTPLRALASKVAFVGSPPPPQSQQNRNHLQLHIHLLSHRDYTTVLELASSRFIK